VTGSRMRYSLVAESHEHDPEMIEREIARDVHEHTLAQSEGSSGWSEAYASQSEANIKADRFTGRIDPQETINHIQHLTKVDQVSKTSNLSTVESITETERGMDNSDKEVIQGPLGKVLLEKM